MMMMMRIQMMTMMKMRTMMMNLITSKPMMYKKMSLEIKVYILHQI